MGKARASNKVDIAQNGRMTEGKRTDVCYRGGREISGHYHALYHNSPSFLIKDLPGLGRESPQTRGKPVDMWDTQILSNDVQDMLESWAI